MTPRQGLLKGVERPPEEFEAGDPGRLVFPQQRREQIPELLADRGIDVRPQLRQHVIDPAHAFEVCTCCRPLRRGEETALMPNMELQWP